MFVQECYFQTLRMILYVRNLRIISERASISRVILEFLFALPVFACNWDASCSYADRGLTRIVTYFFINHRQSFCMKSVQCAHNGDGNIVHAFYIRN
jgi:hypothetical protein